MKKHLFPLAAAGLLLLCKPALAATSFEPGVDWKTIEGPHFKVNYPANLEGLGRKVLAMAEDAHAKVAPFMKTTTYEKTDIVCFDTYDDTNANASNTQHNRINLNLHPPSPDDGFAIGRYDNWIRYVILHEYTHILHADLTPWATQELNAALGSIFFSNFPIAGIPSYISQYIPSYLSESPRFITEGWAVTTESRFTPGGRATEGDQDMKMRMATLEHRLYSIDQVNGSYLLDWPAGGNEYDYGTLFFQYVMKNYGEEVPARILKAMGQMPWLGIDFAVGQVIHGKNCSTLYDEMIAWMNTRYASQLNEIQRYPLTESTRLTFTGRHHHHSKWLADGTLFYTGSLKGKSAALFMQKPDAGAQAQRVFGKDPTGDYAMSADGRTIFYSQQGDDSNRFTSYSDLWRYDTTTHQRRQLTTNYRGWGPTISPDGQDLVCVVTAEGSNYLAVLDPDSGKERRRLTKCTLEANYANPVFAADGKHVLVSLWANQHYNLVEIDFATGAQTPVTTGNALDFYPSYSPDGRYVIFTSDRSGVFNQYALRRSDNALFRLTNVVGGAFEGNVSPDGKTLAFTNYTGVGYDIHTTPFDPDHALRVSPDQIQMPSYDGHFAPRLEHAATPIDYSVGLSAKPRDYSPWPSIMPTTYVPIIGHDITGTYAGFSMVGQDLLRQHFFGLVASYTFGGTEGITNRPIMGLYYQNDQFLPSLSLFTSMAPQVDSYVLGVGGENRLGQLWQNEVKLELTARLPGIPLPLLGSNWVTGDSWQFGWRTVSDTPYAAMYYNAQNTAVEGVIPVAANQVVGVQETAATPGLNHSLFVNYQMADNARPGYSISPESGSIVSTGYEQGLPVLGGQGLYERFWGDYRRYFALPWAHHVLAIRGIAGLTFSQNGGQFTMGDLNYQYMLNQLDLTQASDVSSSRINLRGYSSTLWTIGNKAAFMGAEYRFPLMSFDKGLWTLPIYFENLHGVVGLDVGNIWDSPYRGELYFGQGVEDRAFHLENTMVGTSFEVRTQMTLLRYLRTNLRLGIARGITSTQIAVPDTKYIVGFGNSF